MKYNIKKSLTIPLSSFEQQIEDSVDRLTSIATPKDLKALRDAGTKSLETLRGGHRPGSGRKARPHVRTTSLLDPDVRKKLERLAERHGSLSQAAEVAIRCAEMA